mmetsp:Transcript_107718/g.300156  ORF Transcript_107718/g.300156 Transcript_107718/m.300156 type:complete len:180 (-) Transcript_107718:20-559(-)|eukprot:CAMPEP_0179071716 /NCGR_PEP_ID=MMETSP0796-20121207/31676_1 /TAXON_ID=73915 /ORGANISM="Pyrodinium bahamense, Strain pbaha01" /LENGTH=179 /DNA_ID=CAMNT_0020768841 /DNA_START=60 /DNA_END=599 /DNA_ORIENTATION=-
MPRGGKRPVSPAAAVARADKGSPGTLAVSKMAVKVKTAQAGSKTAAAVRQASAASGAPARLGAGSAQGAQRATLLERREAARQQPKAELTEAERAARNRSFAKRYAREQLVAAFGPSRDGVPRRRKKPLIPEEDWEDPLEVAPTRRKISRVDENLKLLAGEADSSLADLQRKALKELGK